MPQSSYTEDDVIQAILDVTENGLSQNQAAQKNGVPPTTLSDRLRGLPSKSEVTQPAQLLCKSEESRLVTWILQQEALGYAPSHSQVRATVAALLRQQGRERPIGVHWLARFIKRHDDIKTKVGKRQEAARFNSFTPMAVNWYFDIRESEYGWIKPENTVNVDEGGIMAGFGLDSLVIGSSDPRRKAFLKGSQSRTWTTFIEAVTADGRLLKPGIIFKGKELQQQWFIDEFRKIADWYYITSDNGWTDNHIAVEWLKEVYLPRTQPADESDARLIILDGHGSHVSDEWMATCFLNNVYCCYLPAHCSHGLQPLENSVFNASKAAYRKELQKLTSLTDSAPVDKVNFIKAYARARAVGMTKKNILSGWRVTGNWPISRRKALMHPEIQPDKKETTPGSDGHRDGQVDSDHTPTTSRHIRDLGKNKSPSTRRRYSVISRGFEAQESKIASLSTRIASLEEEVGRLSRGKKRKAIPNPNKRFMTLAEVLVAGETIFEANEAIVRADAVEDVIEVGGIEEDERSNSEEEELTVDDWKAPSLGDQRPLHSIIKFTPLRKFELITRYFRTFDYTKVDVRNEGDLPKSFQAAEEWPGLIQKVSNELYLPGTNLTVDEYMVPFTGRLKETTLVKNKPTPVGFKVWVIAQQGFFLRWLCHVKSSPYTALIVNLPMPKPVGKKGKLRTEIPLSNTQSVVVHLVKRLLPQTYHVFTDNLFSSPPLFRLLRQFGFGATATARPKCGISTEMKQIKETGKAPDGMRLRYNEVILIPTQDKKAIQIAWKDSGVVLFISTVHSGAPHERTPKKRKLLAKRGTKIEAQQLQQILNGDSFKIIPIPTIAAQYNDEMNHVDRGD
ncbi:Pogo transposable element with ZNF domain [Fusarium oxysporum f. sp. cubense]|uniref:Pogo transposable element with ZNF domain n=2 Tax=Fusarium oxysporum TaxID=5507 RepID=A0A559KS65_FUSOC|nr:Pogo transposable element with ZNF domain [Fusarium oxysporum f. sp. cubense]